MAGLVARAPIPPSSDGPGLRHPPEDLLVAIGPSIGRAAMRWGPTCERSSNGRLFRRRNSAVVQRADRRRHRRTRRCPRSHLFAEGATGSSTPGQSAQDQLTSAGVTATDTRERSLHGKSSRGVLLVPARRRARRTDGGRDPGLCVRLGRRLFALAASSSIAALARRSACAFSARPTCSNVTRPISCASRRAFACSGCKPGVLHLVVAEHLLDEQQRVGADVQRAVRRARAPTRARRAGRDIRRRCWSRRRSIRGIPRRACRPAARCGRRSRRARDCRARRRRCRRRLPVQGSKRSRFRVRQVGRRLRRGAARPPARSRGCGCSCRTG